MVARHMKQKHRRTMEKAASMPPEAVTSPPQPAPLPAKILELLTSVQHQLEADSKDLAAQMGLLEVVKESVRLLVRTESAHTEKASDILPQSPRRMWT